MDEGFGIGELYGEALERAMDEVREHLLPEITEEITRDCMDGINDMLESVACYPSHDLDEAIVDDERWEGFIERDAIGGHLPDAPKLGRGGSEPKASMSREWNRGVGAVQSLIDSANAEVDGMTGVEDFDFNSDEEMSDAMYESQEPMVEAIREAWGGLATRCLMVGVGYMRDMLDAASDDASLAEEAEEQGYEFSESGEML